MKKNWERKWVYLEIKKRLIFPNTALIARLNELLVSRERIGVDEVMMPMITRNVHGFHY